MGMKGWRTNERILSPRASAGDSGSVRAEKLKGDGAMKKTAAIAAGGVLLVLGLSSLFRGSAGPDEPVSQENRSAAAPAPRMAARRVEPQTQAKLAVRCPEDRCWTFVRLVAKPGYCTHVQNVTFLLPQKTKPSLPKIIKNLD